MCPLAAAIASYRVQYHDKERYSQNPGNTTSNSNWAGGSCSGIVASKLLPIRHTKKGSGAPAHLAFFCAPVVSA